jgi:hypothetical protein
MVHNMSQYPQALLKPFVNDLFDAIRNTHHAARSKHDTGPIQLRRMSHSHYGSDTRIPIESRLDACAIAVAIAAVH